MLGFPDGYLAIPDASPEDTRCELAGDAMVFQVLVRILATLPEAPGAWPPLGVSCTGEGLIVEQGKANGSGAGDQAVGRKSPSEGEVRPGPAAWTIEGQQWMTAKRIQLREGSA